MLENEIKDIFEKYIEVTGAFPIDIKIYYSREINSKNANIIKINIILNNYDELMR